MINKVLLSGSTRLRRHEELVAKHELLIEAKCHFILRELIPHRSDNRGTFLSCMLKSRVEVVSLCVSLVDRIENYLLDSFRSCPRLAVIKRVDVCVSSEERVEDTSNVLLDEVVIGWCALESWQIRTSKDHA